MPTQLQTDLVTFNMLVGDSSTLSAADEIPQELHVIDIRVELAINKLPIATFKIVDGTPYEQDFVLSNSGLFAPGKYIEIKLGYNNTNTTVFKGIVVANNHQVNGSSSFLQVTCKHEAVKMTIGKKSRHYNEIKDSDVAEFLLAENNISDLDIQPSDVVHEQLLQTQVSDWDFMVSRLDVCGLACLIDGAKVIAKKPATAEEAVLKLTYGENIYEFNAEIDARTQATEVNGHAWDYSIQDMETVVANDTADGYAGDSTPDELAAIAGQPYEMRTPAYLPTQELQALVDAKKIRQSLSKIKGTVRFQGNVDVKPGSFIELAGVGDQFNGKIFVSAVIHQYGEGNWFAEATLGWEEAFFAEKINVEAAFVHTGQCATMQGLQIGVVTDIIDPNGEDRIKICLPMINLNDEGVYARIAVLDAGAGRGTFFRPEVGDEVVVGFMNNDVKHPVILGMLHSSAKPAPFVAEEANDTKGYVSRSEVKITINDGEKSVTIETPGGRKLAMNDDAGTIELEDPNGNKIVLDSEGILVEAATNLTLKAGNSISIQAAQLDVKADMSAKIAGGSALSIESSGIAEIKGSMVMIN
ncbi:type VI secretion system tip protein VgrG [Parapedobacter tibetensis]|uniref:type VI secretion system tip protein VgrG n=1 Tax=Parapedobacter tibetensis TaxID=2972951 RepID=UPI00214D7E36|nr:type VI secretion system tip protein VgrG [Parapedobacter tibetensis]